MLAKTFNWIASVAINSFLDNLTTEQIIDLLEKQIDLLEDFVKSTPNKVDDDLIPLLKKVRDMLDIAPKER